jgi:hypothetical protein
MEPLSRDGNYPHVAQAIKKITDLRLSGKEHAKRRPATLLRVVVESEGRNIGVEIRPTISSSSVGWTYKGNASIKTIDMGGKGRGLQGTIKPDGTVRITSWSVRCAEGAENRNRRYSGAIWKALDLVEDDPTALISTQQENCGLCGKGLSDPASRARGVGPECWGLWDKFKDAMQLELHESGEIKAPVTSWTKRVQTVIPAGVANFYSRG